MHPVKESTVRQLAPSRLWIILAILATQCPAYFGFFLDPNGRRQNDSTLLGVDYANHPQGTRCKAMTPDGGLGSCGRYGIKSARLPNFLNLNTLTEAQLQFRGFDALVQVACADELPFLLCMYYFPPCQSVKTIVTPCRNLCERVKAGCLPIMRKFGVQWPVGFVCEKLQNNSNGREVVHGPNGEQIVCVDSPQTIADDSSLPQPNTPRPPVEEESPSAAISLPNDRPRNQGEGRPNEVDGPIVDYCANHTTPCKKLKVRQKTFRRGEYDWVLEGRLLEDVLVLEENRKAFNINVTHVFHRHKKVRRAHLLRSFSTPAMIYTEENNVCACPRLSHGTEYLLAGHLENGRLLLRRSKGLAAEMQKSYPRKVKSWLKKLRREARERQLAVSRSP